MAKVILDSLGDLENEPSALNTINVNSDRIEAAMENTLSRDGSAPNEMNTNLDMNNFRIYNLPYPVLDSEPIRKNEYDQELGSILINVGRAEAAALEALGALESFQATYIGARAVDPVSDGNGDPLTAGDLYYNTTNGKLRYYNGSAWVDVPVQNGLMTRQTAIATGGQTDFTVTGGYTAPYLQVFYNGVLLFPSEYTATNGTTVVLTSGALADAELSFVKYEAFAVPNALVPSNNLSDVADVATARSNLGLGALSTLSSVGTAELANDAVTFDKIQNITDNRLLGRSAGSDGDAQHIVVGTGLALSGGTLTASAAAPVSQDSGFELAASVAGNALTIALKTTAGADASGSDPINIAIGNASGQVTTVSTTAAKSIVVSSGSTLGTTNNVAFRAWVLMLANGEMAVVNCRTATGILSLNPHTPIATITAEGGAGAADTAGTVYATTGTTNQNFVVLGYVEYSSGLATAGTYGSAPSITRVWKQGMPLPNTVVQSRTLVENTGSTTTSTSLTDVSNTSLAFTLTSAANAVLYNALAGVSITAGGVSTNSTMSSSVADGSNNALVVSKTVGISSGGGTNTATFGTVSHLLLHYPGATSFTYKLRHLSSVGTATATTNGIQVTAQEIMV